MPWQQFKHSGIVSDLSPIEAPKESWTYGRNVRFLLKASERAAGYQRFAGAPSGAPLFALGVDAEDIYYWIYCTAAQIFVTDGTTHYDVTPAGGLQTTGPNEWTGCLINGLPVLNNTHNAPVFWNLNTSTKCQTLPGWPANALCEVIRSHKYHLFALNVTDAGNWQPSTVWWSASAPPGSIPPTWVPGAGNDAGDMTFADTSGEIIDGLSLRDYFVIYKLAGSYAMSYVGGTFIYTQRKLFIADGIIARHCVVEDEGYHYVLSAKDLIKHDGQNSNGLLIGKVLKQAFGSLNPDQLHLTWMALQSSRRQLYIGIAIGTDTMPTRCILYDLNTGDCGVMDIPPTAHMARGVVMSGLADMSWDNDAGTWDSAADVWNAGKWSAKNDSLLACMPGIPALMAMELGDPADGAAMSAELLREGLVIEEEPNRVFINAIKVRIDGAPGDQLQIIVGGQADYNGPTTWGPSATYTIGQNDLLPCNAEGRYISVRVLGNTLNQWSLKSYRLEYQPLGEY